MTQDQPARVFSTYQAAMRRLREVKARFPQRAIAVCKEAPKCYIVCVVTANSIIPCA